MDPLIGSSSLGIPILRCTYIYIYMKSLIEEVESVIKRKRWKAFFFDRNEQDNNDAINNDNFGFKSRKCPPKNSELGKFEADLLDMVHNIKFRKVNKNSRTNSTKTSAKSRNRQKPSFLRTRLQTFTSLTRRSTTNS